MIRWTGERTDRAKPSTPAFVIVLVGLMGLAGAVAVFGWFGIQRTYFYGTYVCGRCGAEKTVGRREFAGLTYHGEVEVGETAISRVLQAHQRRACQHEWHLLRFGSGSAPLLRAGEQADGGTRFLTGKLLLTSDTFARELAATPRPREAWAALWRAGEAAPEETDDLLSEWDGPGGEPFAQWWARNGERVRELGTTPEG